MGAHREAGGATRGLTALRRSKMVGISPTKTAPTKTDMHSTQHNPFRMKLKQWIATTLLAVLCHAGIADAAGLGGSSGSANLGSVNCGATARPAPRLLRASSFKTSLRTIESCWDVA